MVFSIWNITLNTTHGLHYTKNNKTNRNMKFLQPYPIVAAVTLLVIRICIATCFTNIRKLFLWEELSRMNTHTAHEYTIFAKLLHNWHEQWPSKKRVTLTQVSQRKLEGYYKGIDLLLICVLQYMNVVGLCLKWYILYQINFIELITKDSICQCSVNPY